MRKKFKLGMLSLLMVAALGTVGCEEKNDNKSSNEYTPRLDTQAKVMLNTAGFFGNFEALDQVTNDFNKYYPNVEFSYEQISIENYGAYLDANPNVDIIMTSEEVFQKLGTEMDECCVDLSKEDIYVGDIQEDMLKLGYHNGKLSTIPMGQNIYGLVVNVDLLKKEGLSVPDTYDEFINALKVLKEKGYTPIQGPESKIYAELTQSMLFDIILSDKDIYNDLMAGKESVADKLKPVLTKLDCLIENDYIDKDINETYPNDNYDQAILKFFEGDVPFWVCNTEKVSGMKKRESKSEAFKANPFEYKYVYVPLGENGVYAYREPWFGFSVNKSSQNYDYAVEFIRFLATKDEINKIADVKGVPSVAKVDSKIAIYQDVLNPKKAEMQCVNKGEITPAMVSDWYTCVNKYAAGQITLEEALSEFISLCSK